MAEPRPMGAAAGRDGTRAAIATIFSIALGSAGVGWMENEAAMALGGALGLLLPRVWDALMEVPT